MPVTATKELMQVRIEKLVYGGEGLGHHDGHTVFVPFVLPGEVAEVRAVERRKKFIRARAERIAQPAAARIPAPCPHFTVCGGCHYQHIPYETQLAYKTDILRETLRRLGGIEWSGPVAAHPSPPYGYRNRAQWKARPAGGGAALGYFRAGSNALCAVEECGVLAPRLADTLARLRSMAASGGPIVAALREVEAFADEQGGGLLLNASFTRLAAPARAVEALRTAVPAAGSILLHEAEGDRFTLDGDGGLDYAVEGAAYRVGHLSFFQVNRHLLAEMARTVTDGASGELAWDLYAGVGLFSVPLARRFARVVAVESNQAAACDLEVNAARHAPGIQVVHAATEKFLAGAAAAETPGLVVADPPRAGLEKDAVAHLLRIAPREIVYLSCDPATLARDLAALTGAPPQGGYDIVEVRLFDVFPQTYHIETLVRLRRKT